MTREKMKKRLAEIIGSINLNDAIDRVFDEEELITIGNGAKVNPGTTGLWFAQPNGEVWQTNHAIDIELFDGVRNCIFLTLAEAEAKSAEIHKGLGHFRSADGVWVDITSTVFTLDGKTLYPLNISGHSFDWISKTGYSTPEAAAAAWLKLVTAK